MDHVNLEIRALYEAWVRFLHANPGLVKLHRDFIDRTGVTGEDDEHILFDVSVQAMAGRKVTTEWEYAQAIKEGILDTWDWTMEQRLARNHELCKRAIRQNVVNN